MAAQLTQREEELLKALRTLENAQATTEGLFEQLNGWEKFEMMEALNNLGGKQYVEFVQISGQLAVRARDTDEVSKIRGLSANELIIYQVIKASGNKGLWIKDIKTRSNLHSQVVTTCIKNLEKRMVIKAIKSIKSPTKKFYMLYNVVPSVELTGGAWYTDDELDVEFIDQLSAQLHRYILSKSRPKSADSIYPNDYSDYPTAASLTHWLNASRITPVELSSVDVQALLDRLVYDGKVNKKLNFHRGAASRSSSASASRANEGGDEDDDEFDNWESTEVVLGDMDDDMWVYVATKPVSHSGNAWTDVPCGKCPVFDFCKEGGPVSPSNCVYYQQWLEF